MLSSVETTLVGGLLPLFSQYRTDRGWHPAARARSACVSPASIRAARIWRPETMLLITRLYIYDSGNAATGHCRGNRLRFCPCPAVLARRVHWSLWRRATKSPCFQLLHFKQIHVVYLASTLAAALAVALADRLCIGRRVCGLFWVAEIRTVEADTEEFGKPFIGGLQKRLWFQSKTLPPSNRG